MGEELNLNLNCHTMNFTKLKSIFLKNTDKIGQQIDNQRQWRYLMKQLCIQKMIKVQDMDHIDSSSLVYPIDYEHFIAIIASSSMSQEQKDLQESMTKLATQLNDTKSTINAWNTEGFTPDETKSLINILSRFKEEMRKVKKDYKIFKKDVSTTNQIVEQTKDQITNDFDNTIKTSF